MCLLLPVWEMNEKGDKENHLGNFYFCTMPMIGHQLEIVEISGTVNLFEIKAIRHLPINQDHLLDEEKNEISQSDLGSAIIYVECIGIVSD